MTEAVRTVLATVVTAFVIYIAVRYFWPLLLVLCLAAAFFVFRVKRMTKEAQKQMEEAQRQMFQGETNYYSQESLQDQLFQQSLKKAEEPGEIVDVEFRMKDEPDGEKKQG